MSSSNYFRPGELKNLLKFHIESNRKLVESGRLKKYAVNVIGTHGLGKTEIVRAVSKELGMDLVKINLAQLEELSDLVGFPITQYEVAKQNPEGEIVRRWVTQKEMENLFSKGWNPTKSEPRMSYAKPEWIANRSGSGILLIDDWTRADNRFIQACMDLIYEGKYISWELPKDWHIILTSNPDDGNYLVSSQDDAQKDRYFEYNMQFHIDDWAEWAENANIDSRCINFMILYPEATEGISNYNATEKSKICVSPRAWTMFFDIMSNVENFEKNISMIKNLGEGSVGTDASNLFCQFISSGFDKLISPKEILFNSSEEKVMEKIKKQTTDNDGKFRPEVAHTIATRLTNYTLNYLKNNNATDDMISRLEVVITSNVFNNDIAFAIANRLLKNSGEKLRKLFGKQKVASYVLS